MSHHPINPSVCPKNTGPTRRPLWLGVALSLLALTTLACNLFGAARQPNIARLPQLTRTPLPTLTPTAQPDGSIAAAPAQPAQPAQPAAETAGPATTADPAGAVVAANETGVVPVSPTPTVAAITGGEAPAAATPSPTASPTARPQATSAPIPVVTKPARPTLVPEAAALTTQVNDGWKFSNIRLATTAGETGLTLVGNVINDTGSAQELAAITGAFFDTHGQEIAGGETRGDWLVGVLPQGGQIPFKLTVPGIKSAANFDLTVEASAGQQNLRQNFQVLNQRRSVESGRICVTGKLRNPGAALESYLKVGLVLYDAQNNVVNFSDTGQSALEALPGGRTTNFEICTDSLGQEVDRFELQTWGQ